MGRHFPDLMTLMPATVIPRHRLNEGVAPSLRLEFRRKTEHGTAGNFSSSRA
jgi:hypothetical protein